MQEERETSNQDILRMNANLRVGRSSSWVAERSGRKKRENDKQTHVAGDPLGVDMPGERLHLVPSAQWL